MATSTAQRTGIWIIAVALTLGTVAGFVAMIIAPKNDAADQASLQAAYTKYQKDQEVYQAKVAAQAKELSPLYYPTFSAYKDAPAAFTAEDVKELSTKDLKEGDGAVIDDSTEYSAYYIGWNPKGKVFDQSIEGESLKAPIPGKGLIPGWLEGVKGMKLGGIRELTIPADNAYGEAGSGEDIPANSPIKFIVMAIKSPEAIPQPVAPKELQAMYGQQ